MLSIGLQPQHHCVDGLLPLRTLLTECLSAGQQFLIRMEPHRGTLALQNRDPLDVMAEDGGLDRVLDVIGRMNWGIVS